MLLHESKNLCWSDESKFIKTVVVIVIFLKTIRCLITLTKYCKNMKMIGLHLKKNGMLELSEIRFLWNREQVCQRQLWRFNESSAKHAVRTSVLARKAAATHSGLSVDDRVTILKDGPFKGRPHAT